MATFSLIAALLVAVDPAGTRCPAPVVDLVGSDRPFAVNFADGSARRAQTEANVREAFRAACAKGLLKGDTIPELDAVSIGRVFLENWPDANIASLEADQLTGGAGWRLLLGYHFVASDSSVNVPTADEIEEAIYCAVRGATEQEQAETGRCLPD